MNRNVNAISGRLSLRPPQRDSLEILARVVELIKLDKDADLNTSLEAIRSEFPNVTDFEREFPSLCFALATGVGKTRLMGAFIAYLHLAAGVRHFFVMAPNLTIYNKLIRDFTPNTPKYVLQGIAEFAGNPPEIITGENYENGRGVRDELRAQPGLGGIAWQGKVHINIFNISKINSEVRGGAAPRIKRLSEYIGQSYFDYLAGLDDLVLLMDESHRYRASAGVRAINELKPNLGLELTATPQVESGARSAPFKNVIYSYPLSSALNDGFIKEPAVVTRENFDKSNYSEDELERLKLEDGIRVHEDTKVELQTYALQSGQPQVKPFMLVVAQDTDHAQALVNRIKDDSFFDGRYKDKVVTVHSNQRGEERDETVERLLAVEDPNEPTEIVVHVNMLKEGWDVTNLYTIVPLRAANSRTLVEQSIGRGLRLPYGRRVGVKAVDRLNIVAHDRFQEIIDEANRPDSIIRAGVVIGRDISIERKETVIVKPALAEAFGASAGIVPASSGGQQTSLPLPPPAVKPIFSTPAEQQIAQKTVEVIRKFETLPRAVELTRPEVQAEIVQAVKATLGPSQMALAIPTTETQTSAAQAPPGDDNIEEVVKKATEFFIERGSMDVPRIIVAPTGEVTSGFEDFDLDVGSIHYQPVAQDILIHHLQSHERERLRSGGAQQRPLRLEDYLVHLLVDYDDVCYDEQADLLYKLSGQVVAHLRSYLKDEDEVENVLQYYRQPLAELIHAQMQRHRWERAAGYEAHVSKGFITLEDSGCAIAANGGIRNFRETLEDRQEIRNLLFTGFRRCLYSAQKFDSDTERRFAVLLEDDHDVLKWFKPPKGKFHIYYRNDQKYEPDFIVETRQAKYLCEPKRASEMDSKEVTEKANAAAIWCRQATEHESKYGGKPWSYLLIPHDAITANKNLNGLAAAFARH
jgi:type III restriction enzyme